MTNIKNTNLEAALHRYRNACHGYGQHFQQSTDTDATNAYFNEMNKTYRELMRFGSDGVKALLSLINDPSEYVRLWPAISGLQFAPTKCLKVIEEATSLMENIGFTAELAIQRWKSGELTFPMVNEDRYGTLDETRQEREKLGIVYSEQ
jgi:Domain of unknown function (DUF2019)